MPTEIAPRQPPRWEFDVVWACSSIITRDYLRHRLKGGGEVLLDMNAGFVTFILLTAMQDVTERWIGSHPVGGEVQ